MRLQICFAALAELAPLPLQLPSTAPPRRARVLRIALAAPLSAGARHSWAEIEARGRTIREDFAAEYGVSLPIVAIDLGRWDKKDGPFEAVAR